MSESRREPKAMERFVLDLGRGRDGLKSSRWRYWSVMKVYLTPIALIVCIKPRFYVAENKEEDNASLMEKRKNELEKGLRQARYLSLEAGYVMPVVGVLDLRGFSVRLIKGAETGDVTGENRGALIGESNQDGMSLRAFDADGTLLGESNEEKLEPAKQEKLKELKGRLEPYWPKDDEETRVLGPERMELTRNILDFLGRPGLVDQERRIQEAAESWRRNQGWHKGQFLVFSVSEDARVGNEWMDGMEERVCRLVAPEHLMQPNWARVPTANGMLEQMKRVKWGKGLYDRMRMIVENSRGKNWKEVQGLAIRQLQGWMRGWVYEAARVDEGPKASESSKSRSGGKQRQQEKSLRTAAVSKVVQRVKELRIKDFRGFIGDSWFNGERGGNRVLNTDADIVVLEGANGSGKTSFLEALMLLLTGYSPHGDLKKSLPSNLFSLQARASGGQSKSSSRAERFEVCGQVEVRPISGEVRKDDSMDHEIAHIGVVGTKEGIRFYEEPTVWNGAWPPSIALNRERYEAEPELDARVSGFFQDSVNVLYDEDTNRITIRDVLEPLPFAFEALREVLPGRFGMRRTEEPEWIRAEREKLEWPYRKEGEKRIRAAFQEWVQVLEMVYNEVRRKKDARSLREAWPVFPDRVSDTRKLVEFCRDVLVKCGYMPRGGVQEAVKEVVGLLRGVGGKEDTNTTGESGLKKSKKARLNAIDGELKEIEESFPNLQEEIHWFDVADMSDTPSSEEKKASNLGRMLRDLQKFSAVWGERAEAVAEESGGLGELARELKAVDMTKAGMCAEAFETWYRVRRDKWEQKQQLQAERAALKREVENVETRQAPAKRQEWQEKLNYLEARSEDVQKMAELEWWQSKRKDITEQSKRLNKAMSQLRRLSANIERQRKNTKLRGELEERVNQVLDRFAIDEALQRVDLEDDYKRQGHVVEQRIFAPKGAGGDKRGRREFSSGQKSQIGIALLVAQNEIASRLNYPLGHRVLILDDASSTYDVSNLSREALLWRQLAYHENPQSRRQIFIASHHQDMTNQLIDNLCPPGFNGVEQGRSGTMRVLRFKEWSRDGGPEIEQFKVRSEGGDTGDTKDDNRRETLQKLLRNRWI